MKAKEYRDYAYNACKKYESILAVIFLLYIVIVGIAAGSSYGSLAFIIVGPFEFSLIMISKKVSEQNEVKVEDLFSGFNRFKDAFLVYVLKELLVFLWTLVFIIPGIIKIFAYAMSEYILLDNPGMSVTEVIDKSNGIMKGHKWELFCMWMSYFGWFILCTLTFGILSLWVMPRVKVATYAFYRRLCPKKEAESVDFE